MSSGPFRVRLAARGFAASVLVAWPGLASSPGALADRAAAIDRPVAIAEVKPEPIVFGRAVVTPKAGARVWRIGPADRPSGLWLDGGGTLAYTVDDPVALPVTRKNLKSATSLRFDDAGGRLVVREELAGAVVWGWELAARATPVAGSASGAPAASPAWVADTMANRRFAPPSITLLESAANGVPGAVYALFDGAKERLLATFDPRPASAVEELLVLWKLPQLYRDFAGDLVPQEIAEQPVGRSFAARRPSEVVARKYQIAVTQTGEKSVRIRTRAELEAVRDGISAWTAELIDETYDDGVIRAVRIDSVAVDGRAAAWSASHGALLVELGRSLAKGERVTVEVTTEGEHVIRPAQDSFWWLGFEPWYPRPVEMRDTVAEYELEIDVAGPWIPYASGRTTARASTDGRNRLSSRLAGPMRTPVVTVGKYSEVAEEVAGVSVHAASYAFEKPDEATRLIRNFGVLRQCLEKLFGEPYPFDELDILEVNQWGFGMAPAGVILVTREAFTKAGMVRAMGETSMGADELFAHEVAHAYWANLVRYDTGADQWLSESFAEYTSALCLAMAAEDEKQGRRLFEKKLNEWRGRASQVRSGVAIVTANDLAGRDDLDRFDRFGTLYARGPLVLQAIREELRRQRGSEAEGDRYFAAFMRAVVKNFAHRAASTEDLIGILEQITKQPWRPFFDRYVYGTETPKRG
jgi:hypothetical protein